MYTLELDFETFSILFGLLAYVIFATAALNVFRRRALHRKKHREARNRKTGEFVDVLRKSIASGVVNGLEDVHNIYLGFFDESAFDQWKQEEITLLLRKLLVNVSRDGSVQFGEENIPFLKELISLSEAKYNEATQALPFSKTPEPERGLLTDILELTGKENSIARDKLRQIAQTISARQQTINQLSDEKGKSLRWAKWGVFGTVLFSGLSIALTIFY